MDEETILRVSSNAPPTEADQAQNDYQQGAIVTSMMRSIVAGMLVLGLLGCAGKDFVRPDANTLKNGQTTYAQVTQMYGKPFAEGSVIKNDKTVKSVSYAYASLGGKSVKEGVVPARAMGLYFYNDTLVGYEFISSMAEDNTDFDESRTSQIVKGTTTQADLIQLIGKPSGYAIYPMIKATTGQGAVYTYMEVSGGPFTSRKTYRKGLVVTFSDQGIVTDLDFSSSGTRQQ